MRIPAKWPAVFLFIGFGTLGAQDASNKPASPPTPPPVHLTMASLTPEATVALGGERHIAATPGGVWVSSRAAGTLTKIDPKTNTAGAPVSVGKEPCSSVLSAFGSLWTPLCGPPGLARLDSPAAGPATTGEDVAGKPATVITIAIESGGPIVSGTGSIWMVTNPAGTLARIDPDTNAVVAEVTIPAGASAVAFGDDALWVASATTDTVTRVNGYTNVVMEHIKVGRGPVAVSAGAGGVWVHNAGDGTVSRIDPKTNKVAATIKTGVTAKGAIAVGEGSVWVSAPGWPLTRIDPASNVMAQQFTGPGGGALAIGLKSLWIAATPTEIWRVDPRRVEATRK